ncbi:MAG: TfoX/Sxy family protein [Candidatus Moranbacteria bacterium]|nr:TfoX/Sxy family protein [Candidatus Moranbacteria bacterium]
MSTKQSTVDYILDQLVSTGGDVSVRKMFGEYALYCDGKVVGLICDDTLFIKITGEGKTLVGDSYKEGYPYPGAKASMEIDDDLIEDHVRLSELVRITADGLPIPKPKRAKSKGSSK